MRLNKGILLTIVWLMLTSFGTLLSQEVQNTRDTVYIKSRIDKYQKTEGIFVNATLYGIPFGLDIGKRITPNFNLGIQVAYLINVDKSLNSFSFGDLLGIGAYGKYYLSENQSKSKGYIDGVIGLGFDLDGVAEGSNKIKPYGGLALGLQLASRNKVRFYFEIGFTASYLVSQEIIRNPTVTIIKKKQWANVPQVTFIGLEF